MDLFEKYFNGALRFLSFRARSEKEVKDFLFRKKVDNTTVEKIVSKLKEKSFLNDLEFAKRWIEQRTAHKLKGLRLIKLELQQKGIDKDTIEKAIYDFGFTIDDEITRAKKAISKVLVKYQRLPKEEGYRKLGEHLLRRGFTFETARKVIDEVFKKRV